MPLNASAAFPTQTGWYLFFGTNRAWLTASLRPRLVYVSRNAHGNLSYIGHDVMQPREYIGLWVAMDDIIAQYLPEAQTMLDLEVAKVHIPRYFAYSRWGVLESITKFLAEDFAARLPADRAARVVTLALEQGILLRTPDPRYPDKDQVMLNPDAVTAKP